MSNFASPFYLTKDKPRGIVKFSHKHFKKGAVIQFTDLPGRKDNSKEYIVANTMIQLHGDLVECYDPHNSLGENGVFWASTDYVYRIVKQGSEDIHLDITSDHMVEYGLDALESFRREGKRLWVYERHLLNLVDIIIDAHQLKSKFQHGAFSPEKLKKALVQRNIAQFKIDPDHRRYALVDAKKLRKFLQKTPWLITETIKQTYQAYQNAEYQALEESFDQDMDGLEMEADSDEIEGTGDDDVTYGSYYDTNDRFSDREGRQLLDSVLRDYKKFTDSEVERLLDSELHDSMSQAEAKNNRLSD